MAWISTFGKFLRFNVLAKLLLYFCAFAVNLWLVKLETVVLTLPSCPVHDTPSWVVEHPLNFHVIIYINLFIKTLHAVLKYL